MFCCTFAGHRNVLAANADQKIEQAIERLMQSTDDSVIFYTGGMGEFDQRCAAAVRRAKRSYPKKDIRLYLVLPYMTNRINTDRAYYETFYDDVIIPIELADVHYKAAIKKRNQWMVDRADMLIAYVYRDHGGAYETLRYAQKAGVPIVNIAE